MLNICARGVWIPLLSVLMVTLNPVSLWASFKVHEWGTYTSFVGSDGTAVQGLHEGDEALPDFVHTPVIGRHCSYAGCFIDFRPEQGSPLAVTQRLETPVLYFYSDQALRAKINVEFPLGVVSEWFPLASQFSPNRETFAAVQNGTIQWDIDILAPSDSAQGMIEIPPVTEDSVWAPSRRVSSNFVRTVPEGILPSETEKFIFYRGIGQFSSPVSVFFSEAESLEVSNLDQDLIPNAYLLRTDGTRGFVQALSSIRPAETLKVAVSRLENTPWLDLETYLRTASEQLKLGLVQSGLTDEESQAMVDTWRVSYFLTPGTRILYIAPRRFTDQLLPIQIQPQPDQLTRPLVGRIEIMSGKEEQNLINQIHQLAVEHPGLDELTIREIQSKLGRFFEPKLRRAREKALGDGNFEVFGFAVRVLELLRTR